MKTITLQGTENNINNLILDNDLLTPKDKKLEIVETRVYVVDTHEVFNKPHSKLTDEEFKTLSEKQGTVYTLESFQKDFNIGKFDIHFVIRIFNESLNN